MALQQAQEGNRPEAVRAARAQLDTVQTALTQLQDKPVREEDIQVARLNIEAAEAAWRTAQEAAEKAGNAYSSARDARDHLPSGLQSGLRPAGPRPGGERPHPGGRTPSSRR